MPSTAEVTQLLQAWGAGEAAAFEQLAPLVQVELRRLAKGYLRQERPGHVLQTTALVNEAFMRLIDWHNTTWENRAHFFGVAAQLMRRVLVDEARAQHRLKRGGDALRVSLTDAMDVAAERHVELEALDDALTTLAAFDERKSRIIELRFFGGLSVEETAQVLSVSTRTILREWSLAQAWLFRELNKR